MAVPGPLRVLAVAAACVFWLHHVEGKEDNSTMSPSDASFCHGGLEVIYPEVDINKCLTISAALKLRQKMTKVWDAPHIHLCGADKRKKYLLMMVDPDAPSRTSPTRAHWRHWLVADIKGSGLRRREFKGTALSEYIRPTPPQKSGFHRYQFMLFEQPAAKTVSLTEEEKSSPGNWDPQAFIKRFDLGEPVASVQFLTQNPED
ncbi:phosphatidylethanolamine-binding protein 4 [Polymixia lowei]